MHNPVRFWKCCVITKTVTSGRLWVTRVGCTNKTRRREASPQGEVCSNKDLLLLWSNKRMFSLAKGWATVTGICKHIPQDLDENCNMRLVRQRCLLTLNAVMLSRGKVHRGPASVRLYLKTVRESMSWVTFLFVLRFTFVHLLSVETVGLVPATFLIKLSYYHWSGYLAGDHKWINRYKFPNKQTLSSGFIYTPNAISLCYILCWQRWFEVRRSWGTFFLMKGNYEYMLSWQPFILLTTSLLSPLSLPCSHTDTIWFLSLESINMAKVHKLISSCQHSLSMCPDKNVFINNLKI